MRKIDVIFLDEEEDVSFWKVYKRDILQVLAWGLVVGLVLVTIMWFWLDSMVVKANAEVPTPQQIIKWNNHNLLCEWQGVPAKLPVCPLDVHTAVLSGSELKVGDNYGGSQLRTVNPQKVGRNVRY